MRRELSRRGSASGCLLAVAVLLTAFAARAQTTLVLQPGSDGRDTFLNFAGSATNWGASDHLQGYGDFARAALLSFDLSSIEAGSTCLSADLTVTYVAVEPDASPGRTWTVWELLPENAGWVEGSGTGTLSDPGESDRVYRISPTTPWFDNHVGGFWNNDVDPVPLTTTALSAVPVPGDVVTFTLPCPVIERWFGSTAQNPGIVLTVDEYGATAAHDLASSDNGDPAERPRFSVTYQPPGAGSDAGNGSPSTGGVTPGGPGALQLGVGCGCQQTGPDLSGLALMAWLFFVRRRATR